MDCLFRLLEADVKSISLPPLLVSLLLACLGHIVFLALIINCVAAASRPKRPRKTIHPMDTEPSLAADDDPSLGPDDLELLFTGQRAEARDWNEEERAVLETVQRRLGPEMYTRAEQFDHLLYRMLRYMWNDLPRDDLGGKAAKLIHELLDWRHEEGVETILDGLLEQHDEYHKGWPSRIYGCDKFGHPIVAERIALIDVNALTQDLGMDMVTRHRIQHYEAITRWKRACSNKAGHRLYKQNVILDLKDFAVFDHFNEAGKAFLFALVNLGNQRYPETLYRCFIINAPIYFRIIWSVISSWLDAQTTAKIRILGGDSKTIHKCFQEEHIGLKALPTWLGGGHHGYTTRSLIESFVAGEMLDAPEVEWDSNADSGDLPCSTISVVDEM